MQPVTTPAAEFPRFFRPFPPASVALTVMAVSIVAVILLRVGRVGPLIWYMPFIAAYRAAVRGRVAAKDRG